MTIHQLQYFKVLASVLHYTNAAKQLHISQSNLSYAISQLEYEIGTPLFFKSGKQITLTKSGEVLKATVNDMFQILEQGLLDIVALRTESESKIRLGYAQSLSNTFIPYIVEEYYQFLDNRDVIFSFASNQEINPGELLRNGLLDVVFSGKQYSELTSILIAQQELMLIAPRNHRFAQTRSIQFKELETENIITLMENRGLYQTVKKLFQDNDTKLNICLNAYDYNTAINYVFVGEGVAFLPASVLVGNTSVCSIRIRDVDTVSPIYMTWNEKVPLSRATALFLEFMRKTFKSAPS